MRRLLLLTLFICCLPACLLASTSSADDYVIRIDTFGFVDKPSADKDPEEATLRSIVVMAHPNAAFHAKVTEGKETLIMNGHLQPSDNGTFKIRIHYTFSIDTGVTVITENGLPDPLPSIMEFETTVDVAVGDPVTVGGLNSTSKTPGNDEIQSRQRCVLVLEQYVPAID